MPGSRSFRFPGWTGEVKDGLIPEDLLQEAVRLLADPGQAKETLHWGRDYLYITELPIELPAGQPKGESATGDREVVVKQFSGAGWRARWKRKFRGSKARRSWRAAEVVLGAGVLTPEPVLLIESERAEGPSLFVTRRVDDFVESRYIFRAIAKGTVASEFPWIDRAALMIAIGKTFARLHAAGVWHRDLSIGNLLVQRGLRGSGLAIQLIDLDRARLELRLGALTRLRDICRLPILETADRVAFWRAYWGRDLPLGSLRGITYRCLQQGFLAKNRWKPRLRAPLRAIRGRLVQRKAYAHIPEAPRNAPARDKAVWDHLSDQPHQHASRGERTAIRLADTSAHAAALLAAGRAAPKVWARYRELLSTSQTRPTIWRGAGVALRPLPSKEAELLESVERLGVRNVLLRLHPWQSDHSDEEALARELHARGYDLAFALPQNRELVRDPERWRAAVRELAERFRPMGASFQIGQAINRSKWGVWNYREYLELAAAAGEILSEFPGTRLLGPAIIDFEFQATAAVLNMKTEAHFDAVSALLYVDRRGAPENTQLGFDTIAKCALLKAIAETSRNSGDECWITEVNWPLWEGPHSPAGRTVSVDEETQADYLARYYLLALTSGFVERVYWWQLAARGYGLCDPSGPSLRRRPSFEALATLESSLEGARFVGATRPSPTSRVLRFERGGGTRLAAWSVEGPESVVLGGDVERLTSRDGEARELSSERRVELTGSPIYIDLAEPAIDSAHGG